MPLLERRNKQQATSNKQQATSNKQHTRKFRQLLLESLEPKKLLASDLADSSLQKELTSSLGSIPEFSLTRAIQSNIDSRYGRWNGYLCGVAR